MGNLNDKLSAVGMKKITDGCTVSHRRGVTGTVRLVGNEFQVNWSDAGEDTWEPLDMGAITGVR